MSQAPPPPLPPNLPGPVRPPRYEPGAGTFAIGDAFAVGWAALKANYGVLLGSTLLCLIVYLAGSIIGGIIPVIGSFVGFFLAPLWVSMAYVYVLTVRGKPIEVTMFFPLLKEPYWSLVVIQLLVGLIGMVVMIPVAGLIVLFAVLGANAGGAAAVALFTAAGLFGVAAFIAMLYVQVRIGYAGLLFMDAPTGSLEIIESISLSWNRTKPYAMPLVGLALLLALISLGSLLLLVVGVLLIGIPLSMAVTAAAYDMICPPKYAGMCPVCNYDCRNSPPGRCPECGAALPT